MRSIRDVIVNKLVGDGYSASQINTSQHANPDHRDELARLDPPLDAHTLGHLWDPKPPPNDRSTWYGKISPMFRYLIVLVVLSLAAVLWAGYIALGAKFGPSEAWTWLTGVVFVGVVHAFVVEPLRVLVVALYWTVFRHQLIH